MDVSVSVFRIARESSVVERGERRAAADRPLADKYVSSISERNMVRIVKIMTSSMSLNDDQYHSYSYSYSYSYTHIVNDTHTCSYVIHTYILIHILPSYSY